MGLEVAASLYDYAMDQQRQPTIALPLAAVGGAGTLQNQGGSTGWNTLAAKGTWRSKALAARTSSISASAAMLTNWAS